MRRCKKHDGWRLSMRFSSVGFRAKVSYHGVATVRAGAVPAPASISSRSPSRNTYSLSAGPGRAVKSAFVFLPVHWKFLQSRFHGLSDVVSLTANPDSDSHIGPFGQNSSPIITSSQPRALLLSYSTNTDYITADSPVLEAALRYTGGGINDEKSQSWVAVPHRPRA